MLHIYLVRHGQKDHDPSDPALTEFGHQQAQHTGEFLKSFPITKIVASPRLRTQQTAGHLATALSLNVETDPRLMERMDFGEFVNGTREDFFKEWTKASSDREYVPRWGDSSVNTGRRIEALIHELDQAAVEQHVVLVTHGGAIADVLRNIFDAEQTEPLLFDFKEGRDFRIDECSVTRIGKEADQFHLHELHCISHLTALMPG